MMILTPILLGFFSIFIYLILRLRNNFRFSLVDSFYLGQIIYFIGAVLASIYISPYLDYRSNLLWLSSSTLIFSTIFFLIGEVKSNNVLYDRKKVLSNFKILVITFSVIIFNISFVATVYNSFFSNGFNISSIVNDGTLMYARKTISSGDSGYYAPGLIKLIRDILAPTLIFYILVFYKEVKKIPISLLIISTIIAILAGGRRNPLLALFFAIYVGIKMRRKNKPMNFLELGVYLIIFIGIMGFMNILLGRGLDSIGLSFLETNLNVLYQIFYRIFIEVPNSNIIAYNFVLNQDFKLGEYWFNGIMTLLPGTQIAFSNELHSFLGGSYQGNAVLGFPLSSYINFGFLGVSIIPLIILWCFNLIDRMCSKINRPFLWSIRMIMFVYIPLSYDPQIFLISGGLIFLSIFVFEKFKYNIRVQTLEQKVKNG